MSAAFVCKCGVSATSWWLLCSGDSPVFTWWKYSDTAIFGTEYSNEFDCTMLAFACTVPPGNGGSFDGAM